MRRCGNDKGLLVTKRLMSISFIDSHHQQQHRSCIICAVRVRSSCFISRWDFVGVPRVAALGGVFILDAEFCNREVVINHDCTAV
jgi:hypothetical protein